MTEEAEAPTKVFISYSWDSDEHKLEVLKLSNTLREHGIDCQIDRYHPSPAEGWYRWMAAQIENSDFVLVICTEKYHLRYKNQEARGQGLGVTWEGGLIIAELYQGQGINGKFIPILLSSEGEDHIPKSLQPYTVYRLFNGEYDLSVQGAYQDLYRHLTEQPAYIAPQLGKPQILPPIHSAPSNVGNEGEIIRIQQPPLAQKDLEESAKLEEQVFIKLTEQVRERCRQKIMEQHSRMRLLSGEEIGVDQLYVDVWLLNRSPRTYTVHRSNQLRTFNLRYNRSGLGAQIKPIPSFEVTNANSKLVIFGKPGMGKTAFLKHLAVDWCNGKFQPDLIAVLIELGFIRDEHHDKKWDLLAAIGKELGLEDRQQVKVLLEKGRLLVLMDGLDEVQPYALRKRVQSQLQEVAKDYSTNRFILTCRTQIIKRIYGFDEKEVDYFGTEQVEQFVHKWFKASGKSDAEAAQQWEMFESAVDKNPALKELTVTPLLLSLMCKILQEQEEMPSQVDWLYEKGIMLLLSKWNDEKPNVWEVDSQTYKELSVERREKMLIGIAARRFESSENSTLFDQQEVVAYITQLLQLADPGEGVTVLKAIEAQHGLLVERAEEVWSFSHLTFQEHFTIQWLGQLSPEQLVKKIAVHQCQERVRQLVKSHQPADRLVQLIKQAIDQSIAQEPALQRILSWVLEKSKTIQANNYKSAAIRAFYFALDLDLDLDRNLILTLDRNLDRALDITDTVEIDIILELIRAIDLTRAHARNLALDSNLAFARDLAFVFAHARARELDITHAFDLDCGFKLTNQLEQLKETFLRSAKTYTEFQEWWQANGTEWVDQFRQVVIRYRNIGHDWQLTPNQTQQLRCHYAVNHFLVDLMKIEGAITDRLRAEIEDSLLLPWKELQRRYPDTYGQSQSP